ncbi:MAG TPA: RHS repeat-associated core domain-containing protein, partial [Blastocatellia bacterium]
TYVDATVGYGFDEAGRLTRLTDTQSGAMTWGYDDANRLSSETTPQGVVRYSYNKASQRATMTAADRPVVTYGYDDAGRISTIKQGVETFTWAYDDLSRMKSLSRPNNVTTSYEYDAANKLSRILHANAASVALEDFKYGYNVDDEIESIESLGSSTLLPTARTVNAADAANRIPRFGQAAYTFDEEGQTRTKTDNQGTTTYDWDARGRLAKVTLPNGQVASYGYDALGRRTGRTAAGLTTNFLYDGQDVVLDRGTGGLLVDYLNGPGIDNKLRQTSSNFGALYFLRDHLGSTEALTHGTGGVLERAQYEAYGASANASLTRYGFTGRELDAAAGLIYYRARWMDSSQGRFISEDPIGFSAGEINLYSYVSNNPINYSDPSGNLLFVPIILGAIGRGAISAAFEAGAQVAANWYQGEDLFCLDIGDIAAAGVAGIFLPSVFREGKTILKRGQDAIKIHKWYWAATSAKSVAKHERRLGGAIEDVLKSVAKIGVSIVGKKAAKEIVPPVKNKDTCECQDK